jgi:hypothetical protein
MKTKEEIEQLAEIHANQEMEVYKSMDLPKSIKQAIFTHCLVSYNIAYTQCQEDNKDKKYTEEDLHTILRLRKEWYSHTDKNVVRDFINSLNKK